MNDMAKPRLAEFRGGPINGSRQMIVGSPQTYKERSADGTGTAHYVLQSEQEDGLLVFEFREFFDSRTNEEQVLAVMKDFYENYNPSIYSRPPGLHKEVSIEVGHRRAPVDEDLVEIIKAIWRKDWETLGSCQELPKRDDEAEHRRIAYITFPIARHGREFAALLTLNGVENHTDKKTQHMNRLDQDNQPYATIDVEELDVFFQKKDFEKVLAALVADH